MSSAPEVSVIIATFNSSATLRLSLASALAQEFADFELWVVGDACTDDSESVVRACGDQRVEWVNLPQNSGSQSAPNNEGIRRARGKYIAYLGHDDLWLPWHLGNVVAALERNGADLAHDLGINLGPTGVLDAFGAPPQGVNYGMQWVAPSSLLHRRALVGEIGAWRPPHEVSNAIDLDFTSRAFAAGKKFTHVRAAGVLKFPSPQWRNYARVGEPPQEKFWHELQADPRTLMLRLLAELPVDYSRSYDYGGKKPPGLALRHAGRELRLAARGLVRATAEAYGRERWPVNILLRWNLRRRRRGVNRQRGLEK